MPQHVCGGQSAVVGVPSCLLPGSVAEPLLCYFPDSQLTVPSASGHSLVSASHLSIDTQRLQTPQHPTCYTAPGLNSVYQGVKTSSYPPSHLGVH